MGEAMFVMGIDFGTDSARAVIVDPMTGGIAGRGISIYRRWADLLYCDPAASHFRQHPLDYLESLEKAGRAALTEAGKLAGKSLRGVCVATTGSTPCPVDADGMPLALSAEFADNPNAMFFLWKDHSSSSEAAEINERAASWKGEDFLRYQGLYSSEWFWAKMLRAVRKDQTVRNAAQNWIEECEWITAELCAAGPSFARCCTAAGHKALWHSAFGGLPSRDFLVSLDPHLGLVHDRYTAPVPPDRKVGVLCRKWLDKWGLDGEVPVCGSIYDAHAGAVGVGIRPGTLVKIVGTSAVDMAIEKAENIIPGETKTLFGMAENSIIPGYVGVEAGQAAFGDVFKWLERLMSWSGGDGKTILAALGKACENRPLPRALALDWFNGRRYPRTNDLAKACVFNLDLGVDAPEMYQALALGVAFGARRMMEGFLRGGIRIDAVVCAGGIAGKSPYIMQALANAFGKDVGVSACTEACAKGAAMYAAVVAGTHQTIFAAQDAMGDGLAETYAPDRAATREYEILYRRYLAAGEFMESLSMDI